MQMEADRAIHSEICFLNSAFKMVPEVGIAPTSPRLQRGANLSQLLGENDLLIEEALRSHRAPLLRLAINPEIQTGTLVIAVDKFPESRAIYRGTG